MDRRHPDLAWSLPGRARKALQAWAPRYRGPLRTVLVGENATFRVRAPAGWFALRLYRPGRWEAEAVRAEHAFMAHLGRRVGVEPPVPGRDGDTLQFPDERGPAALVPWVAGRLLNQRPSRGRMARLGAWVGKLHRRCLSFESPYPRPAWDEESLVRGPLARLRREATPGLLACPDPALAALLPPRPVEAMGRMARRVLRRWRDRGLATAFLHADLHWGNLKVEGSRIRPLDFDDCGPAPLAYDLAVIDYASRDTIRDDEALLDALLRGYNRAAPAPLEKEDVLLMTWARHAWLVGWILARPEIFRDRAHLADRVQAHVAGAAALGARLGLG